MKVHYSDKQKDYDFNARKKERTEEIDRILDKLRKSGYGSLTDAEKRACLMQARSNALFPLNCFLIM